MRIAQITDLHVSTPGTVPDDVLHTVGHLEAAVARLQRLDPDVVLITGDLVDRGHPDEYARLGALLAPLRMPVWVVPGNHDERGALRETFDAVRARVSRVPGPFVQYVVDEGPVRLIGLDTVVPGAPGGHLCDERLAWLDARLSEAPDRPTLLFQHHPPLATGVFRLDEMGLERREALAAVVRRHPQVERIVCGHVHRAITSRFAGTVVTTCPSTAHQVALQLAPGRGLGVVMEPPSLLLHVWLGPEDGLVTHVVPVRDRPVLQVHDGADWLDAPAPPPGFYDEGREKAPASSS